MLEVRGLVPPGAGRMQVSHTSKCMGQLGIQLTGATGCTLFQNASLGVGEGGGISTCSLFKRHLALLLLFFFSF